jgi:hypothetical protein
MRSGTGFTSVLLAGLLAAPSLHLRAAVDPGPSLSAGRTPGNEGAIHEYYGRQGLSRFLYPLGLFSMGFPYALSFEAGVMPLAPLALFSLSANPLAIAGHAGFWMDTDGRDISPVFRIGAYAKRSYRFRAPWRPGFEFGLGVRELGLISASIGASEGRGVEGSTGYTWVVFN